MSNHYGEYKIKGELEVVNSKFKSEIGNKFFSESNPYGSKIYNTILHIGAFIYVTTKNGNLLRYDENLILLETYSMNSAADGVVYEPSANRIFFNSNSEEVEYFDINTNTLVLNYTTRRTEKYGISTQPLTTNIFTIERDFDSAPQGTLWNAEGFGDFSNYQTRNYSSFYSANFYEIGTYVLSNDFIMKDTINNKYYKIKFLTWTQGGAGGGFSYEREEITGPTTLGPLVTFTKTDYGSEVDIIDTNLEITRGSNQSIYNSALEGSFSYNETWGLERYDNDYNYLGRFIQLPPSSQAYSGDSISNSINNKIYYTYDLGSNTILSIDDSVGSNITTFPFSKALYNGNKGLAFDSDRNRLYMIFENTLSIVDGDTDSIITSIDMTPYGNSISEGISYSDNQIIISIKNNNLVTVVSFDADSFNPTIITSGVDGNYSEAITIYSGGNYYLKIKEFRLMKWDGTEVPYFSEVKADSSTDKDNTVLIPNKSGTIALLDDVSASLGSSVIVSTLGKTVAEGAIRESIANHFSDLTEAITAASSGDTIYVYGGTYTLYTNLAKAGVKYVFSGRPVIYGYVTMITDLGSAVTIDIKGDASFIQVINSTDVFSVSNTATQYNIECYEMVGPGSRVIYLNGGTDSSVIKATKRIECTLVNWTIRIGEIGFARGTIICPEIRNSASSGSTRLTILTHSGDVKIIGNIYNNSSNGDGTIATFGGTFNIIGNIIANTTADSDGEWQRAALRVYSPSTINITGNITGNTKNSLWVRSSATGSLITIKGEIESSGSRPTILIEAGSFITLDGKILSNASINVIEANNLSTGYLKLNGSVINQHVPGAATNGVNIFGSTGDFIFNNVTIKLDDFTDPKAIISSSPKNIMIYGYVTANINKHANITDIIGVGRFNYNSSVI